MLQRCRTREKKVAQLHAQVLANGFSHKNFLLVKLLSCYATSGNLRHATAVFRLVQQPSSTLYNQLIRAFSQRNNGQDAVLLYKQMRKSGNARPNGFTYSALIASCATPGLLREGWQVHGMVLIAGFASNVFVLTSLVNMYAAGGLIQIGRKVFDEMRQRNVVAWNSLLAGYMRVGDVLLAFRVFDDMPERDVVSWTIMIAGCAQNGRCMQALAIFRQMSWLCTSIDEVMLVSVLSACADLGDLELGRQIHTRIYKVNRPRKDENLVSLNNSLMQMYVKCGDIEKAHRIFIGMPRRTTISWSIIIMGFAVHDRGDDALSLFQKMRGLESEDEKPDEATFLGVLCACSHMGLVDEGRHYFELMTKVHCIAPQVEHYGCMVDMLGRAARLDEARELIERMPIKPNDVVWGSLLSACCVHRYPELAIHAFNKLLKLNINPKYLAGHFVLLSNMYAAERRWNDVRMTRERMEEMGILKSAGRSGVYINDV